MRNNLDNFEKLIRDAVEGQEAPYDASQWSRLEQQLDKVSPAPSSGLKKYWVAAGISAVLLVGAGIAWYATSDSDESTTTASEETPSTEVTKEHIQLSTDDKEETPDQHSEELNEINSPQRSTETEEEHTAPENLEHNPSDETVENGSEETNNNPLVIDVENDELTVESEEDTHIDASTVDQSPSITAPTATFEASALEICAGETVKFTPTERADGDYVWNFGDGKSSGKIAPEHQFNQAGQYIVRLETRAREDNSITDKSDGVLITVRATPDVDFAIEKDNNAARPLVHFINKTDKATQWTWNFRDGNIDADKNTTHIFNKKGRYDVELLAKNEYGCSSTESKEVVIDNDYNLLAPTGFTVDGDGINEKWIPEALTVLDFPFTLTIYNRSGKQVFQSQSANRKWDGIDQSNGKACGEGFYVWYVILTNEEGQKEEYKGTVSLWR